MSRGIDVHPGVNRSFDDVASRQPSVGVIVETAYELLPGELGRLFE